MNTIRILFLGNSTLMAAVEASLNDCAGIEAHRASSLDEISSRCDAVISDQAVFAEQAERFMQRHPGLPVLLLDWNKSTLMVLNYNTLPLPDAQGLTRLLRGLVKGETPLGEGNQNSLNSFTARS